MLTGFSGEHLLNKPRGHKGWSQDLPLGKDPGFASQGDSNNGKGLWEWIVGNPGADEAEVSGGIEWELRAAVGSPENPSGA